MRMLVRAFLFLAACSVVQQTVYAQACSQDDNKEATKAVEHSGAKTYKVNASDLGAVGAGISVYSSLEEKYAAYARAYAYALRNTPGLLAVGSAAVITLTFTDGSREDFFHIPGRTDPESNATIAGTQYAANGTAVCPQNQGSQANNGSGSGGGVGGSNGGTGGGGWLPPSGGTCVVTIYADGSQSEPYDCH